MGAENLYGPFQKARTDQFLVIPYDDCGVYPNPCFVSLKSDRAVEKQKRRSRKFHDIESKETDALSLHDWDRFKRHEPTSSLQIPYDDCGVYPNPCFVSLKSDR